MIPNKLVSGPVTWFVSWPDREVPRTGSAVYTIWDREGRFIYAGMSGRSAVQSARANGPYGRLNSHASGRRSGDQFCIYVCDRLVLPKLHNRIAEVASGTLSLDAETRAFIRAELGFRVAPAASPQEAFAWEKALCTGSSEAGAPSLNPWRL
jgi:hypothetical protein